MRCAAKRSTANAYECTERTTGSRTTVGPPPCASALVTARRVRTAARAVGQALGHNPFAPLVPCHRILAAQSGSGGFSAEGGTRTKLRLLEIEGAVLGGAPGLFDA